MEGVLVFLMICATIYAIFYLNISTRHKERMAIMDKDIDPNLVWGYNSPAKSTKNKLSIYLLIFLKIGMILIGFGVGFLVANYLHWVLHFEGPVAMGSSITICIGLSLVIFYFIGKRALKNIKD